MDEMMQSIQELLTENNRMLAEVAHEISLLREILQSGDADLLKVARSIDVGIDDLVREVRDTWQN